MSCSQIGGIAFMWTSEESLMNVVVSRVNIPYFKSILFNIDYLQMTLLH